jgi:hypothetical protein
MILVPANAASLVSNGELVGEIEKVYFGPEHKDLNDQYCMLILKHESGKKIAVLEDLYDCYWSRMADERPAAPIHIPESYIFEVEEELVNEMKVWAQVDEFVFAGEY